jgi:hypothetical protein
MSLIQDLLTTIAEVVHARLAPPTAPPHRSPTLDGRHDTFLVREGYKVHTEPSGEERRRSHRFQSLGDFAGWLNRHAPPKLTDILVDDEEAVAFLDVDHPNADRVTCDLVVHPRAARWLGALGKRLSQRDLVKLLLAGKDDTAAELLADGTCIGRQAQTMIGEIGKLNVTSLTELRSDVDARGMLTFAGSSESRTINGKIPSSFSVTVPWFVEVLDGLPVLEAREDAYELELLVDFDVVEGKPQFVLSCPALEERRHEAVQGAIRYLRAKLHTDFLVGMGVAETTLMPRISRPVVQRCDPPQRCFGAHLHGVTISFDPRPPKPDAPPAEDDVPSAQDEPPAAATDAA